MSEDDPFGCFGSDSDNDDDGDDDGVVASIYVGANMKDMKSSQSQSQSAQIVAREESCGVLSFHKNTEQSLLVNVRNNMNMNGAAKTSLLACEGVLQEIDKYCFQKHWMMHIGPEKKGMIQDTLINTIQKKIENTRSPNRIKFIAVELGTYCGYSSICLAQASASLDLDFHLFTVEINPEFAKVAREMIKLAQVEDIVTVLDNDLFMDGSTGDVGVLIRDAIASKYDEDIGDEDTNTAMRIDFLMIDHDKDSYLPDLQRLEQSGLIRRGTCVVADNVLFARIDEYVNYMKELDKDCEGIVTTVTKEASVEYSGKMQGSNLGLDEVDMDVFKDGVEITTYLQDPKCTQK